MFLEHFYLDSVTAGIEPRYILDLGANVGYASMWFAMHYPSARICAIEPVAATVERLRKQLRESGILERCTVLQNAIDVRGGVRDLFVDREGFFHQAASLVESDGLGRAGTIECLSLEEILARSGFPQFDLIKFDIEGIEEVLFSNPGSDFDDIVRRSSVVTGELKELAARARAIEYFERLGWTRFSVRGETVTFLKGGSVREGP